MRTILVIGLCLGVGLGPRSARGREPGPPENYRDLQFYTVSAPAPGDPSNIVAGMRIVNRSAEPLAVEASLAGNPAAGFTGSLFRARIGRRSEGDWTFSLRPPDGFARSVLTGVVRVAGVLERDLFVALQGPDPAEWNDAGAERISNRAAVVATYAPRADARVQVLRAERERSRPAPVLTLAAAGASRYSIVLTGDWTNDLPAGPNFAAAWATNAAVPAPIRELAEALEDLQRCLEIQGGARLPLLLRGVPEGPAVVLRKPLRLAHSPELHDAYRLRTKGENVFLESDSWEGLRNGVYGLLTDHLGCRWFQPGTLGEEIPVPPDRTVRLPKLDEWRGSRWFSVSGMSWGSASRWDRRNRAVINRGRMNFGHSWVGYVPSYEFPYEKYPHYYARDRQGKIRFKDEGWTSTDFCSTEPEVIAIVARKVNAMFAANPEAIVASLDPNDYAPLCLCDRCLALDRSYGVTRLDGTEVADRLLHFSREIYDRLDPRFKDRYLGILIYGYQMELPVSAKPHDHHAGMICNFPPRYDHSRPWNDPTSAKNRDFYRLVTGWGARLTQLGYYDYYGHYYFFGPYVMLHKMREDLPALRDLGGTFLMIEAQPNFAIQGLNHFIAAGLAWDLDGDVDLALDEFVRGYYGPAADPMRRFWLAAEKAYALERPGTMTELRVAARPGFWQELDGLLREAETVVAALPEAQKRFRERVAVHRAGLDYGRLRWEYDSTYGGLAERRLKKTPSPAEAIRWLEQNGARIEAFQKSAVADDVRPLLLPAYSFLDVQDELKTQREALK